MKVDQPEVRARPDAPSGGADARFRHEALLYSGVDDFVVTATPFILDGIRADEPVLVVVGREKIGLLREALGDDAEHVDFRDMDNVGANPARIIPAWYDFVADRASEGSHIRGIGEPISNERSPEALVECQRHESLLNLAFHDASAWWLLCPYDTSILNDSVIEEALRSHPWIQEGATHRPSDIYLDIEAISRPFDAPMPEPRVRPWEMVFALDDLADLRTRVARIASEHGFDPSRTKDLVVAVNEVAINSLRHGGGDGVLRVWREGDMLTCEIRDRGRIDQPLVGRRRPKAGQEGGFGVWLVHQLCDLVQMRQFPNGSVIRMHMSIPRTE